MSWKLKWKVLAGVTCCSTLSALAASLVFANIQFSNTPLAVLGITSALMLTSLLVALAIHLSIATPINRITAAMQDMAEGNGNLRFRVKVEADDEVGALGNCFNEFVGGLGAVVGKLRESCFGLTAAAEQLSATTSQTASGADRQHADIDQVASAMAEMASTVAEVARNVGMAASDAESADNESNKGADVVARTMQSIEDLAHDIEKASEVISNLQQETDNIGTVLHVIREIADQTNLLALNAAIEAARAGEQGRGFAVVADEVRTLASRTQASTEEIQNMIEKLQSGARQAVVVMAKGKEQASSSVEHAGEAGVSLQAITKAVSVIRDMNNQIASAAEQQSAVTIEIKQSINNISEAANETALGSRETSSGSAEVARLATEMKQLVDRFKV